MAVSKRYLLAQAAKRNQATVTSRAKAAGMPVVVKPTIWERARSAYFGSQPLTHKQLLQNQMAEAGVE